MQKKVGNVSMMFLFLIKAMERFINLDKWLQQSMALVCFVLISNNVLAVESSIVLRMQDMNQVD